jgi:hypothetical protein
MSKLDAANASKKLATGIHACRSNVFLISNEPPLPVSACLSVGMAPRNPTIVNRRRVAPEFTIVGMRRFAAFPTSYGPKALDSRRVRRVAVVKPRFLG